MPATLDGSSLATRCGWAGGEPHGGPAVLLRAAVEPPAWPQALVFRPTRATGSMSPSALRSPTAVRSTLPVGSACLTDDNATGMTPLTAPACRWRVPCVLTPRRGRDLDHRGVHRRPELRYPVGLHRRAGPAALRAVLAGRQRRALGAGQQPEAVKRVLSSRVGSVRRCIETPKILRGESEFCFQLQVRARGAPSIP